MELEELIYFTTGKNGRGLLTSSDCGGCVVALSTQSLTTESGSERYKVFSFFLQSSQCVHCLTASYTRDGVGVRETVSVSVGVGDGVGSGC